MIRQVQGDYNKIQINRKGINVESISLYPKETSKTRRKGGPIMNTLNRLKQTFDRDSFMVFGIRFKVTRQVEQDSDKVEFVKLVVPGQQSLQII